jgi:hypothetical protein
MTSLPRPVQMGLVGLLVVVALFMVTRGRGGNEEASTPSSPAAAAPSETAPSTAAPSGSATAPSTTPSESSKTTAPTAGPAATDTRTLPKPVKTAIDKNKVVVLLIWDPRASVDQDVKSAVDGLSRRGGKVAVFTDKPENVARYTPITGPVDLTQTPTLIVVNRDEVARKATGYLDPVTVDQYVVDALEGAP